MRKSSIMGIVAGALASMTFGGAPSVAFAEGYQGKKASPKAKSGVAKFRDHAHVANVRGNHGIRPVYVEFSRDKEFRIAIENMTAQRKAIAAHNNAIELARVTQRNCRNSVVFGRTKRLTQTEYIAR